MPVKRGSVGADADRVLVDVSLAADPFDDRRVAAGVEQHQVDRQGRAEQILDPVPHGDVRHDVDRLADRAGAGEHERRDLVGRDELARRHPVGRLVFGVARQVQQRRVQPGVVDAVGRRGAAQRANADEPVVGA